MKCIIAINLCILNNSTAKYIEENNLNIFKKLSCKMTPHKQQTTQKNHWQLLANVIRQENEIIGTNMEKVQNQFYLQMT